MGFVIACTGGIIRDLFTGTPSMVIASEEFYVTPVLIGAILYGLLFGIALQYSAEWSIVANVFMIVFRGIAIGIGFSSLNGSGCDQENGLNNSERRVT